MGNIFQKTGNIFQKTGKYLQKLGKSFLGVYTLFFRKILFIFIPYLHYSLEKIGW